MGHYLSLCYFTGHGAEGTASGGTQQHEKEVWHVHPGHSGPPPGGERECPQGKSDDDWHHQSKGVSLRSKTQTYWMGLALTGCLDHFLLTLIFIFIFYLLIISYFCHIFPLQSYNILSQLFTVI